MCLSYINLCFLKYTLIHMNYRDFLIYTTRFKGQYPTKIRNLLSSIILVIDSQSMDCIIDGFVVHRFKP